MLHFTVVLFKIYIYLTVSMESDVTFENYIANRKNEHEKCVAYVLAQIYKLLMKWAIKNVLSLNFKDNKSKINKKAINQ